MFGSLWLCGVFSIAFAYGTYLPLSDDLRMRSEGASILSVLGPQLSANASIILPNNPLFAEASSRWSEWNAPGVSVVVEASTKTDVIKAVSYARSINQKFFVQNGGHGWTNFNRTTDAIVIKIDTMKTISIDKKINTVTFGPGVIVSDIIDSLYAAGREMPTGSCSCVGMLGAGLGGGHGRLQGLHGLIIDNLLSAEVLLANGDIATVSAKSHPDLFYALKGAGHNFGVVLEATFAIYDQVSNGMFYNVNLTYATTEIEAVTTALNNFVKPAEVALYLILFMDPVTSEPVVMLDYTYAGSAVEGRVLLDQHFGHIRTQTRTEHVYPWTELNDQATGGVVAAFCGRGGRKDTFTTSLLHYDPVKMGELLESFIAFVNQHPQAKNSSYLFESYSWEGVRARNPEDSAYPNRDVNVIALFDVIYEDASFDSIADDFGFKVRETLRDMSGFAEPRAYLNYARGDEGLGPIYGRGVRLEKLIGLKHKYDPFGDFDVYHPIPSRSKTGRSK